MRVLTSRLSLPWALHFLKKTNAYRKNNTAKSMRYFIRYFIASLLSVYCPIRVCRAVFMAIIAQRWRQINQPERKLSWLPLRAAVLPSTGACGTRSRKKVVDAAERLW